MRSGNKDIKYIRYIKHVVAGIAALTFAGCSMLPGKHETYSHKGLDYHIDHVDHFDNIKPVIKKKSASNHNYGLEDLASGYRHYPEASSLKDQKETYQMTVKGVTVELYKDSGKITRKEDHTDITGIRKIIYDKKGRYADCEFNEDGILTLYDNGNISAKGAKIRFSLPKKNKQDLKRLNDFTDMFR